MFDLSLTGVARNGTRLANALASAGHEVHLLLCRADRSRAHVLDERVMVTVVGKSRHARLPRAFAMVLATPALRRRIASLAPDALVSLGNHGHLVALAASAGLSGTNRVYRISNDLHHPGDGAVRRAIRRLAMALLVRSARRLILVSPHLADNPAFADIRARNGVDIVANGVAIEEIRALARANCGHPWLDEKDEPCIVAVGRLAAQKNYPTLLRAVALANRETPLRLLVLGQGNDQAREALASLAEGLGIGSRVAFLPPVDNPFRFVARASAFVLPSLWEGASNALLEAIALDVPVVASRTAGNAQDVLAYGRFGLIVDPMDAQALARSILWQIGPESCRPGSRAMQYDAARATTRACNVILAAASGASAGEALPIGAIPAFGCEIDVRAVA